MDYVEFARVRRALTIYAIIIALAAIVTTASIDAAASPDFSGHVSIVIDSQTKDTISARDALGHFAIPLGMVFAIAGYCAVVMATIFASSLNKENGGANFVFVKPISRERLALQYMAIDATGIVIAFAIACLATFGTLAGIGKLDRIALDGDAVWIGALGLGIAFMWYGIMQAVTASYRGKGGGLVGWSWVVFGVLVAAPSATFLGPAVLALVRVLNVFNPIAYFSALVSSGSTVTVQSVLGIGLEARVAIAWCIAAIACALAINIWKRVEA